MKFISTIIFAVILGYMIGINGQEIVTLTSPLTKPNTTNFRIQRVTFDIDQKSILIQWIGNDGLAQSATYPTPAPSDHPSQPTGATLLNQVNTGNNTSTSMVKKIYQRLQTDGYIPAGTISGTPE